MHLYWENCTENTLLQKSVASQLLSDRKSVLKYLSVSNSSIRYAFQNAAEISVIVNMALSYLFAFKIYKLKFNLNFDLETLLTGFWCGEFIRFLYISFKLNYHSTWKIKINITYCVNGGSSKKAWIQYKVIIKNYYWTVTLRLISGKNFFYRTLSFINSGVNLIRSKLMCNFVIVGFSWKPAHYRMLRKKCWWISLRSAGCLPWNVLLINNHLEKPAGE